ncbi:MAG TPA: alpha/beta hydrolase [Chthoniobacterales bacterium]|nr:alpha/beta hydrolase [Chthoniobacterales bacterium]
MAKILKRGALTIVGVLLLVIVALLVMRAVRQNQISRAIAIPSPPGIDSLEQVQLGGVTQWIHIRGHNRANPLLLMLHGGPGIPEMPFAYVNAELERHLTIVEWDQRGAGKSFSPGIPPESMTIGQIVRDARELIALLRTRFAQERIFIMGHSTGTVIGAIIAQQHPDVVRALIGISQVADMRESERLLYDFAMDSASKENNGEALRELREVGPPPFESAKHLQTSQKWVNEFAPDRFGAIARERLELLFFSPACSLRDLWRMVRGAKFSFDHLWRELFSTNLFQLVPRMEVPVYFLEGRNDHVVTAAVAERYFDALEAPRGKRFIWFEHSAHWPQLDEPEKFRRVMVEQVLAENQ